jgi:hypothetical protein
MPGFCCDWDVRSWRIPVVRIERAFPDIGGRTKIAPVLG